MCSVSPWRVGQTCSTGFTTPREIWGWPVSCFKNISLFQIMMIHVCAGVYFISMVILGSFFVMNLILGVLSGEFSKVIILIITITNVAI